MADSVTQNPVKDFRCSRKEDCVTDIKVGDYVRSYDWGHMDDCYVEGVIDKIIPVEGCDRYHIVPERRVWQGLDYPQTTFPEAGYFPPINGTRVAGTFQFTNGVRRAERGPTQ